MGIGDFALGIGAFGIFLGLVTVAAPIFNSFWATPARSRSKGFRSARDGSSSSFGAQSRNAYGVYDGGTYDGGIYDGGSYGGGDCGGDSGGDCD